jgi:hypothetical protein
VKEPVVMKMITTESRFKLDQVQVSGRALTTRELEQVRGGTVVVPNPSPPSTGPK